jgi:parallel beta-helix repeat protein
VVRRFTTPIELAAGDASGALQAVPKQQLDTGLAGKVAKGELVVNVKDYGAVGNGSTSDTAAIAAAVAALPADGGVLFFPVPASFYSINAGCTLNGKSNVTLRGAAPGVEIRFAAGTADTYYNTWPNYAQDSIFRLIDCSDVLIENLKLNGNLSNRTARSPSESFNSCLTIAGCTRVTVTDCHIVEGMTDGIFVGRNQAGTASNTIRIANNTITACRRNNISLVGQHGCLVENNLIADAGTLQGTAPQAGIDVEPEATGDSTDVTLRHNIITGCTGTNALNCTGAGGTTGLHIESNTVTDNNVNGINLADNTRTVISQNIVSGHTAGVGLRFTTGAYQISGNLFEGNRYGVLGAAAADKVVVDGNRFIGNTHYGADFLTFLRVQVLNNIFVDNASAQGLTDGAGFACYGTRADVNSIFQFDNNFLMNSVGASNLMKGVEIDATCNARATGNVGKNLNSNTQMVRRLQGDGNWSIDAGSRLQGVAGESNFNDQFNGGGRLLIGSKYHYFGTAAPTTGTWERGDFVYNTAPQIGAAIGWVCVSNGTPGSWVGFSALPNMGTNGGDADATLTVGTSSLIKPFTSTLTANRTVTLSTTGAYDGASFRVFRTGGGAFSLNVGGLKSLAQNQWADVTYNGASWVLTATGDLGAPAPAAHASTHATGGSDPLTPAAIGAVAKGELIVNVKDHGAVGNGTTDDTTAFQTAISSAPTGSSLLVPVGTYRVTADLTWASSRRLSLQGQGQDSILALNGCGVVITGASGFNRFSLRDLTLARTGTAGVALSINGSFTLGVSRFRTDNLHVSSAGGTGIRVEGAWVSTWVNPVVTGCAVGWAIERDAESGLTSLNSCLILGGETQGNTLGWDVKACAGICLSTHAVEGNTFGIKTSDTDRNFTIANGYFEANTDGDIDFGGTATGYGCSVKNSVFFGGGSAARSIRILRGKNVTIEHNSFVNYTSEAVLVQDDTGTTTTGRVRNNYLSDTPKEVTSSATVFGDLVTVRQVIPATASLVDVRTEFPAFAVSLPVSMSSDVTFRLKGRMTSGSGNVTLGYVVYTNAGVVIGSGSATVTGPVVDSLTTVALTRNLSAYVGQDVIVNFRRYGELASDTHTGPFDVLGGEVLFYA